MLLITVAKFLLALASFQDPAAPAPGPRPPEPMMWTGETRKTEEPFEGVKFRVPTPLEKEAQDLARSLRAEIQMFATQVDVKRDYAQYRRDLDIERAKACWKSDYPGKGEVLAEIAAARASCLSKLGRDKEAVYAAWHPFVMPEETGTWPYDRFVWVASNGSLTQLVDATDALPRMVELHKRFPSDAPASKGGDAIEDVVRTTVELGNPQTLKDFGTRCVPALQKTILERPDADPNQSAANDPLAVLLSIDRRAGETMILSTIGKRGPVWTLRAISALSNSGVTQTSWIYPADPYTPPRFDDPLTLQVIDAIAAQPMTALQFFQLLEPLVGKGVVSPAIEAFLIAQVQTTDQVLLSVVRGMLDGVRVGPNKRALYEAFLDSPDPDLRRRCAVSLSEYPVGPATLRATQHPDPNVRRQALRALVRHREARYDFQKNQAEDLTSNPWHEVPRTPEISAALLRLAKDPELSVRTQLLWALKGAREEPPAEVLELLLADADAEVRQAAAYDWTFKPELQAHILEALARDKDPQVLRSVGLALNQRSPIFNTENQAQFKLYLPALVTWLENPSNSIAADSNAGPQHPLEGAMLTPEGARAVFEACVRGPRKNELVPILLDIVRWQKENPKFMAVYDVLDSPSIAELFALHCARWRSDSGTPDQVPMILSSYIDRGNLDPRAFFDLARDAKRPHEIRLRALTAASSKATSGEMDLYLGLLREVKSEDLRDPLKPLRQLLVLCAGPCYSWPPTACHGMAAAILEDPLLADSVALNVGAAARWRSKEALDARTTNTCLARWQRLDPDAKHICAGILSALDPRVAPDVLALWKSELHDLQLTDTITSAMLAFPCDESTPLLIDVVTGDWAESITGMQNVRLMGIQALTQRLDDLGADALLKSIASTSYDGIRKACFDGLEQIRKYQDEKQSWQKRKGGEAAREQAIADLLPMLSDKDAIIRAAAARSLATLQAVEHLPKLVALLKDKDASVREAAQKALDALNTPAGKKP